MIGGCYLDINENFKVSSNKIEKTEGCVKLLTFDSLKIEGLPENIPYKIIISCEQGDIVRADITYMNKDTEFVESFFLSNLAFDSFVRETTIKKEMKRKEFFSREPEARNET